MLLVIKVVTIEVIIPMKIAMKIPQRRFFLSSSFFFENSSCLPMRKMVLGNKNSITLSVNIKRGQARIIGDTSEYINSCVGSILSVKYN